MLFDLYDIPEAERDALEELRRHGGKRGWWASYGIPATSPLVTLFGLEEAARQIRTFEPLIIPGLLQTRAYAEAVVAALNPQIPTAQAQARVDVHLARQEHITDARRIWAIIGEGAIRRPMKPEIMREQLQHLLDLTTDDRYTLQILPFDVGLTPGVFGAFTLFEFDDDVHTPVVYVESQAGNIYMEKPEEFSRCDTTYNHLVAAAASPVRSVELIREAIERL